MFCEKCGSKHDDSAVICVNCGCSIKDIEINEDFSKKKKSIAVLLQFLIGFGAGMFYLRKFKHAIGMLVLTIIGIGLMYIPYNIFMLSIMDQGEYFSAAASAFIFILFGLIFLTIVGMWNIVECVMLVTNKNAVDGDGKVLVDG